MSDEKPTRRTRKRADDTAQEVQTPSENNGQDTSVQSNEASTSAEVAKTNDTNQTVTVINHNPYDLYEPYSGTFLPFGVGVTVNADEMVLQNIEFLKKTHGNIEVNEGRQ